MVEAKVKLSPAQARIVRAIKFGLYSPCVMDGPTLRALIRKGVIEEHNGLPPTYTLRSDADGVTGSEGAR